MTRSLSSVLSDLPDSRLKEIVSNRRLSGRIEASSRKLLVMEMAAQLSSWSSISDAIDDLSILHRMILLFVKVGGGAIDRSSLYESVGERIERAEIDNALSYLEARALLLGTSTASRIDLFLPAAVARAIPVPGEQDRALSEILSNFTSEDLRKLALASGLDDLPTKKADRITAIAANVVNPARIAVQLSNFTDTERAVVQAIADSEDDLRIPELCDRFSLHYDIYDTFSTDRYAGKPRANDFLRVLFHMFWVFPESEWAFDTRLIMPKEIRAAINGPFEFQWPTGVLKLDLLPAEDGRFVRYERVAQDLASLLSYIRHARPSEVQKGGLPKPEMKRAAKWMKMENGTTYVSLLTVLAEEIGLISAEYPDSDKPWSERASERARFDIADDGHRFLSLSNSEIESLLFGAWIETDELNDFATDQLMRDSGSDSYRSAIQGRNCLCRLLLEIPDGRASRSSTFGRVLMYRWPGVFLDRPVGDGNQESLMAGVIRTILETLFMFGVVELAPEGADTLIRLSPYGRKLIETLVLMNDSDPTDVTGEIEYESSFVVQPNLEIVASQRLHPLLLLTLCEFCDFQSNQQAIILKISPDSLRQAFDALMKPDEIIGFLEKHSSTGVPQNLRYTIEDTAKNYGRIRVGKCRCYVTVEDDSLMKEILTHKKIKGHGMRRISDKVAVFDEEGYKDFLKDLRKAGYMPLDDADAYSSLASTWMVALYEGRKSRVVRRKRSASRAAKHALEIDWAKIASDDTGRNESKTSASAGKITGKSEVRALIREGIDEGFAMEVAVARSGQLTVHTVRPIEIGNGYLYAYSYNTGDNREFPLMLIEWARRL